MRLQLSRYGLQHTEIWEEVQRWSREARTHSCLTVHKYTTTLFEFGIDECDSRYEMLKDVGIFGIIQ